MDKSPDAFRTISEVAEMLGTPAHVLRFWESRFPQIRPVKRAGGRRYYRPADVMLLTGIKTLLHDQGMTIRGVQKILREQGVRQVAALSGGELPEIRAEDSVADLEQALAESFGVMVEETWIEVEPESATIIALETALRQPSRATTAPAKPLIEQTEVLADAPELPLDLPRDVSDLSSPLDDSPDDENRPEFTLETPESDAAPAAPLEPTIDPPAVAVAVVQTTHPLDLARRLRMVNPARLARHVGEFSAIHAKLAELHVSLGPVQAPPIAPLP